MRVTSPAKERIGNRGSKPVTIITGILIIKRETHMTIDASFTNLLIRYERPIDSSNKATKKINNCEWPIPLGRDFVRRGRIGDTLKSVSIPDQKNTIPRLIRSNNRALLCKKFIIEICLCFSYNIVAK